MPLKRPPRLAQRHNFPAFPTPFDLARFPRIAQIAVAGPISVRATGPPNTPLKPLILQGFRHLIPISPD